MLKMMKLMNCTIVLFILCGRIQSNSGEALECQFQDFNFLNAIENVYSCSVTKLDNPNDNITITGYSGDHEYNKNDRYVNQLYISDLDTYFIPKGLGSVFNITALIIRKSKLKEIRSKDFQGMQNLDDLNLYNNKLTSLPSDTFSTLPKLKYISLQSNQIKYIGSGVFDQLTSLNRVVLNGNICINKYYDGASTITQMKEDIKVNCDPLEKVISYENGELMKEKDALMQDKDALKKSYDALMQDKDALKKSYDALMQNKDALKKNYDALIQDKDALKKSYDALMQDKDALKKSYDALMQDKDALKKSYDALMQNKDALKKNYDALMQDKDGLMQDKDAVIVEHAAEQSKNDQLKSELSAINQLKEDVNYEESDYDDGDILIQMKGIGIDAIIQMKKDIITNCKNPATTTTTTTTTTQNPMEVELKELYNEVKDQQHKNEIELKTLRSDLKKAKLENTKVTKENDALKKQEDSLMKDKDAVKKLNSLTKKDDTLMKEMRVMNNKIKDLTYKLLDFEANQRKSMEFNLTCVFKITNGGQYTCETRDLTINQKKMKLNEVIGVHLKSKSNQEVTELIIVKSSMFYWSKDIFIKFPALQTLRIQNAQLNELSKGDFSSDSQLRFLVVNGNNIEPLGDDVFLGTEENLTEININSNQIENISGGTFRGLKQLKVLSLKDNLITEIPLGSFEDIVMLEILILTGNKIKFLDGKMLQFNKRLMTLAVDENELREVGEEILNHSKMLKDVNFGGNYCIDERTGTDDEETDERTLNDLIFVIRSCCKNPGEGLNVYNCGRSGSED